MADLIARSMAVSAKAGSVNVKDFGAIGDGISDDTTAIQDAVDTAVLRGGGDVLIPDGIYKSTSTVFIKPNVSLELNHAATIKPSGDFHVIRLHKGGKISGGTIDVKSIPVFNSSCIWLDGEDRFSTTWHNTFNIIYKTRQLSGRKQSKWNWYLFACTRKWS